MCAYIICLVCFFHNQSFLYGCSVENEFYPLVVVSDTFDNSTIQLNLFHDITNWKAPNVLMMVIDMLNHRYSPKMFISSAEGEDKLLGKVKWEN